MNVLYPVINNKMYEIYPNYALNTNEKLMTYDAKGVSQND